MGLFNFFQQSDDKDLAPITGRDVGPMNIMPTAAPVSPINSATNQPTAPETPTPGVTLPTPTAADTPATPLSGLNVAKPDKTQ